RPSGPFARAPKGERAFSCRSETLAVSFVEFHPLHRTGSSAKRPRGFSRALARIIWNSGTPMARIVMKFGGTSVADLDRIHNVARHVKREVDNGHEVAVVVSAMSGKTNELVGWVQGIPKVTGAS